MLKSVKHTVQSPLTNGCQKVLYMGGKVRNTRSWIELIRFKGYLSEYWALLGLSVKLSCILQERFWYLTSLNAKPKMELYIFRGFLIPFSWSSRAWFFHKRVLQWYITYFLIFKSRKWIRFFFSQKNEPTKKSTTKIYGVGFFSSRVYASLKKCCEKEKLKKLTSSWYFNLFQYN